MEIQKVANLIEQKINLLEIGRKELQNRAENKATATANYERKLAQTVLMLRSGEEVVWGGEKIKDLPVTLIEKTARGMCDQEKLKMELAEGSYKNAVIGLQALQSELNGWQSVFRYLEET